MSTTMNRRDFLKLLGTSAMATALPASIARALEISANRRTGSIEDIEHIVILMQENRSFDHYFGALKGVRGFGDPRPVNLPGGRLVWQQTDGDSYVMPFHPTAEDLGLQFLEDLAHDWTTTHQAWNHGHWDQWVPSKGSSTMAHLTRADIPFHYALADAFTVCDAYHCSVLGPTDPNRYYMFSGWVGNDGNGGGPVVDNAEAGYDWSTFPELLQQVGIRWKLYQDIGNGVDREHGWGWTEDAYIGNYGDNSLLYFNQYRNAQPGSPLYEGARTGTQIVKSGALLDDFRADIKAGHLPQVSWVASPEAYCEHPNWPSNYGAWYVAQVLDALTANPDVFAKTALFITFDENDGFFDHAIPPAVPSTAERGASTVSTEHEIFPGSAECDSGPYGMGPRVPMIVVSPWSKGGWVCSQVFDHTSLIQFVEQRFGRQYPQLRSPNLTPWRRAVAGDLTSAFDFSRHDEHVPGLPSVAGYKPPDNERYPDYVPMPPEQQQLPQQESGSKPARALPYSYSVDGVVSEKTLALSCTNQGMAGVCLHVRSSDAQQSPWYFTVEAGKSLQANLPLPTHGELSVYGPNGFLRMYRGGAGVQIELRDEAAGNAVVFSLHNASDAARSVRVENLYGGSPLTLNLSAGEKQQHRFPLQASHGWYDLLLSEAKNATVLQRLAGHVENGAASITDPAIANPRWLQREI